MDKDNNRAYKWYYCSRTLNVRAVASANIKNVLLTGAVVHIAWLVGIAIGAISMYKIMNDFRLEYLPIVICSLSGGLIGSYFGMMNKKKTTPKQVQEPNTGPGLQGVFKHECSWNKIHGYKWEREPGKTSTLSVFKCLECGKTKEEQYDET